MKKYDILTSTERLSVKNTLIKGDVTKSLQLKQKKANFDKYDTLYNCVEVR